MCHHRHVCSRGPRPRLFGQDKDDSPELVLACPVGDFARCDAFLVTVGVVSKAVEELRREFRFRLLPRLRPTSDIDIVSHVSVLRVTQDVHSVRIRAS